MKRVEAISHQLIRNTGGKASAELDGTSNLLIDSFKECLEELNLDLKNLAFKREPCQPEGIDNGIRIMHLLVKSTQEKLATCCPVLSIDGSKKCNIFPNQQCPNNMMIPLKKDIDE